MIWLIVGSLVPSFFVSLFVGMIVRWLAPRMGLVDRPGLHKRHEKPTPMGGGLAIWAGMLIPFFVGWYALLWLWIQYDSPVTTYREPAPGSLAEFVLPHIDGLWLQRPKLWKLLGAGTVLMILGLVDDLRRLDWRLRLAVQTLVAVFTVWQGWHLSLFIDFAPLTFAISVVWIVGLINTFNMLDNMDGLSAGVAAIAAGMLAAVILTALDPISQGPQLFVGGFLLVLLGAVLGFLWHNRPPAKLFMGDAGSYFVGFCLATATISATFAGEGLPRHAILAPLCVLAIPLYDTITVIWIRLREGRSPFEGDRNHISHRLVDLGLSSRQAVLVVYAATAVCGLGAFLLHRVNTLGAFLILVMIALVLVAIAIVELTARRRAKTASRAAPD